MKTAIICDWLVTYAGSERVLAEMIHCYPEADLFAVVDFLPPEERGFLRNKKVKTTFIQKLPFAKSKYRSYLPLMPLAIEQLDLSGYDLILSSSHAVAKGVITGPDQLHISYTHSPMRYAWDLQHQYLNESGLRKGLKGILAKYLLHRLRLWDQRASKGVDHFIANSHYIARRILKTYRREASVIYPPVDTTLFTPATEKENFYLTASRMVPYKKMPLIVEAFTQMPDKRLVVIGSGPDFAKVKAKAKGFANIELLGFQSNEVLAQYMQKAKAFVFAAEEDFGITPLEAQACGTPVLAFGKGGALETVRGLHQSNPTGVFFNEQSTEAIKAAVLEFEEAGSGIEASHCVAQAQSFQTDIFRQQFKEAIQALVITLRQDQNSCVSA